MFNKYVGLEGGFTYSPGSSTTWNNGWGSSASSSSDYYMLDAAVKGVLPLTEQFSLFGKLGIANNTYTWSGSACDGNNCANSSSSWSNTGLLIGAGAAFNLSRQWQLHLEDYTSTGNNGNNPNFFMFGGQYNF